MPPRRVSNLPASSASAWTRDARAAALYAVISSGSGRPPDYGMTGFVDRDVLQHGEILLAQRVATRQLIRPA